MNLFEYLLTFALGFALSYVFFSGDTGVPQERYDALQVKLDTYNEALFLDAEIMERYQLSVDACRDGVSELVAGNFDSAVLEAKDVGDTEDDLRPLFRKRKRLLEGVNADLL